MAASRERRVNAGSKMAKLIEDEEEDEFYTTTYGGFNEVWNNQNDSHLCLSDLEWMYMTTVYDNEVKSGA